MSEDFRLSLRPIIAFAKKQEDSPIHLFQNETLRPILKMQHKLIKSMALKQMPKIASLADDLDRRLYCQTFLNKNPLITQFLTGMVVGLFTEEELAFYSANTTEINKRIKEMLIVRIADGAGEAVSK
jgi:hypothetical protein